MCTTKHKVSPAYSPTVAHECKAYQCTVGRMQGIRMICIRSMKCVSNMSERGGLYIGNDKPDPTTHKALERNTRSVCFFLIGRGELKETKRFQVPVCSTNRDQSAWPVIARCGILQNSLYISDEM